MSTADARGQAARRRLQERQSGTDRELVDSALADLFEKVGSRGPLSDADASQLVSDETEQMRAEKRDPGHVGAGRRG